MSASIIIAVIVAYFALLFVISRLTSDKGSNEAFFIGKKESPWYLVAFGMIGASLSGVTFISVPGWVGSSQFSYMQMVFGYMAGYAVIGLVLMPLYYKLNLTSIYTYFEERFGFYTHKTGAFFFLLSRTIGAAFRLYLVAIVLQRFLFEPLGIHFAVAVAITIALIWIYTFQGGIKTIVWTDTLQTLFMLIALGMSMVLLMDTLDISWGTLPGAINESEYGKMFFTDISLWKGKLFFPKQFIGGMFIAICMTGLDQDMMQKNLSCRNIGEAQTNMFWFSIVLVFVNLLFLALGALLFMYMAKTGMDMPQKMVGTTLKDAPDLLFPEIAIKHISAVAIVFIVGLIAAAYSSADSALTSLTTSVCFDFLGFGQNGRTEDEKKSLRWKVHLGVSFVLFFLILIFNQITDDSVIADLFKFATYTYGPLLGLFAFGILTKRKINDRFSIVVCLLAPVICILLNENSVKWLNGYQFGFEILPINGLLTFLGLLLISKKPG